jgi:hypothetical protein
MILDSDSNGKEEVMQEFIDLLRNAGRTSEPDNSKKPCGQRNLSTLAVSVLVSPRRIAKQMP